jgi:hypothetical protein
MEPLWVSGKGLEGRTALSFLPLNTEIIASKQQGVVLDTLKLSNRYQFWHFLCCCHLQGNRIQHLIGN